MLSLCTKRKTGSIQVIQWLNKLGHGISYDDANCLETSLAESQMCDKVLKTSLAESQMCDKVLKLV